MTAAVVVATRDRQGPILELLESLARAEPPPAELAVVDDGSVHPVRLPAMPFRTVLLRNERSVGPGASRNRGTHATRSDVILYTDDDCVVDRGWIGELIRALGPDSDPGLGGVAGTVVAKGDDLFSRYYDFHRVLQPRPHDAARPRRVPYLVTANCAVRRVAYMRAGGFDGRIPTAGGEDAALAVRMASRGYHFEMVPDAVVRHAYRPGLRDFASTFYRYGLGGRRSPARC